MKLIDRNIFYKKEDDLINKNIIYIFGIFRKILFGVFQSSKIRMNNNVIKKRYYSNTYKFNDELRTKMLKEIVDMWRERSITRQEYKLLEKYINNNVVHLKFGEIIIKEDGKVILEAYDLTTKGEGRVYFKFNRKKDEYMKVYENREGIISYVNKISIKRSFDNIEEFKKNVRIGERKDWEKMGIDEKGEEEILNKLLNMHRDKDIEENKVFNMNEFKVKEERKIEFKEYEKKNNDNGNDDNVF